jgi:hypothetical protein
VLFTNNNHLGIFDNIIANGTGCTSDFMISPGEFESSLNLLENSTVTLTGNPGIGCGSRLHEVAFGASEGAEGNLFLNDSVTVLPGNESNLANLLACAFENISWGAVYNGLNCTIESPGVNVDAVSDQVAPGEIGPITVENSTISGNGNLVLTEVAGDQVLNNSLNLQQSGGIGLYLLGQASAIGNTINETSGSSVMLYVANNASADSSTIVSNSINCLASSPCGGYAIDVVEPGSPSSSPLELINNLPTNFSSPYTFPYADLPDAKVSGNPGLADQLPPVGSADDGLINSSAPQTLHPR